MRPGSFSLCAWASIALSATAAWAQVPAGPVFQVNVYTTGRQMSPHVAVESDGDFVVVWDHRVQYGVTPSDVFARRFAASGAPSGGDFRVNAFTTSAQTVVGGGGVSLDARGNAVVVWDEFRSGIDVFGRRVSAAGAPLGDDFQVNQFTAGFQADAEFAVAPDGRFVVVWDDLNAYDIFGRRFDAFANPLGAEFRVNTYTTGRQELPDVAIDAAGNFTVVWQSYDQDAPVQAGVFGQRFDASGARLGGEFQVNTFSAGRQGIETIAMARDGSAVVAWEGSGPGAAGTRVWARRYASTGAPIGVEFVLSDTLSGTAAQEVAITMDEPGNFVALWNLSVNGPPFPTIRSRRFAANGTPRGSEFLVAAPSGFADPSLASDAVGNFTVAWHDASPNDREVFAQRYGGLFPAAMTLNDGGNGVLEVPDDFGLVTSWRNLSGAAQTFQGRSSNTTVPPGLALTLSPTANYGTVANGAVGACTGTCFSGGLTGTRPSGHVDLTFVETIQPDTQGQAKRWALHVGDSFADVPRTNGFYRFIETLLHRGVTSGCGGGNFCPDAPISREQMSVFLLVASEGATYAPPACTTPVFSDVPASSPFCRFVEELARRGVTGGCGGSSYCPTDPVTREQMAVFLLRTLDPALNPPACTTPMFNDVPASSPFCRWVEELARRGFTAGCGGGNFCPALPVPRQQMAVFLAATFGLTLYGP